MDRSEITRKAVIYLGLKTKSNINSAHNIFCSCPFHKDKTPSLSLDIDNGRWRCFSCKRGGSIEKLFSEVTGQSLYKTLEIPFDEFSFFQNKPQYEEPNYEEIGKDIPPFTVVGNVQSFTEASRFLRRRAIPFSIARELNFQYMENGSINGTRYHNRLLIPIYEKGKLVAIEGRTVSDEKPKTLYPKGSSVNTFYGIDTLSLKDPLYLVEGMMDVATLRKYPEFKNSTAMFGSALTPRQLYLLRKFSSVVVIPNNDEAGDENLKMYKEANLTNISILKIPRTLNGVPMKDVNDIDVKSGLTVQDLLNKKWLKHIRPLH